MRIGIVGTARPHVRDHLEVIAADPHWTLAGIRESDVVSSVAYPADAVVATIDEIVERSDVIVVDTETCLHYEVVRPLLLAGKPLFVEKPLGISAQESREIAALIRESGVRFSTGLLLRFQRSTRELKAALQRGDLGRVLSIDLRFGHSGFLTGWFERECAWMLDSAQAGLGGFGDIGLHLVDLLTWLDPDRVIQIRSRWVCPSHGAALLSWGSVPVTLAAGWASNPGGFSVVTEGERGTVSIAGGDIAFDLPGVVKRHIPGEPPRAGIALQQFLEDVLDPERVQEVTIDDAERSSVLAYALEEDNRQ